jgi:hypothetical protein
MTKKTTRAAKKVPAKRTQVSALAPAGNTVPLPTTGPQFAEQERTPDPTTFLTKHTSDKAAYTILDREKNLPPRLFPVNPATEPRMTLADAIGDEGAKVEKAIIAAGQVVFHALGDTGNTRSAKDESSVTDKLVSDFSEETSRDVPSFCYNLGDIVYSFGEAKYYYDQFYDPYRDYPAPIFAIAGNHDGMVAPGSATPTLEAFLANFCAYGQPPHRTPESGGLIRTANIQPGVYFTLEAPFVRIIGLYSNCLEDPGVISSQRGSKKPYPGMPDVQLDFLQAALTRAKKEKKPGAVIIAVHHPAYVAVTGSDTSVATHGSSPLMLAEIDAACASAGFWPHAVFSGHAHNQQRFTRRMDGRETPFVVCGNGGHAHNRLTKKGEPTLRVPQVQPPLSNGKDEVTFESYDDTDFGYLRVIADAQKLRIEYHPAADGEQSKTPDDTVVVDLATYKLTA